MGQGVLKLPVYDVKDMHFVKCNFDDIRPSLLQREQSSIFIECGIDPKGETWIEEQKPKPLPDRIELDDIVFDAIGLSRGESLKKSQQFKVLMGSSGDIRGV